MATLNDKVEEYREYLRAKSEALEAYKSMLEAAHKEGTTKWYDASKSVMDFMHGPAKRTNEDYTEINQLRDWFESLSEAKR
jgi:hypothetical protein